MKDKIQLQYFQYSKPNTHSNKTKKNILNHYYKNKTIKSRNTIKNKHYKHNKYYNKYYNTNNNEIYRTFILNNTQFNSYSVNFYINVGSSIEKYGQYGISHLLEHMIFKRTSKFKSAIELASYLEEYNITFNAYTTDNKTCYTYSTINTDPELLTRIFFVAKEMLFNMEIKTKDLKIEKNIVKQEYAKDLDNFSEYLPDILNILYYYQHPFSIPTIGYISDIDKITKHNIIDFYKTYYIPENITCFIFGNTPSLKKCSSYYKKYFLNPKIKYNYINTNKRDIILNYITEIKQNRISFPYYYKNDLLEYLNLLHLKNPKVIQHLEQQFKLFLPNLDYKLIITNPENITTKNITTKNTTTKNITTKNTTTKNIKNDNKLSRLLYKVNMKINNINQCYLNFIIPNRGYNDENYQYIKLFTNILGNRKLFTNILFDLLREKYGLTYSINVKNDFEFETGMTYISISINKKDEKLAIKIIYKLFNDIKNECLSYINNNTKCKIITEDKFNKMINYIKNEMNTIYDDISNLEDLYVDKIIYKYEIFHVNDFINKMNNLQYSKLIQFINSYLNEYILFVFN